MPDLHAEPQLGALSAPEAGFIKEVASRIFGSSLS